MFWDISLKLGIYMQQVVLHVKFEFHSNRDTLTYFTAKNRSKSFICIHGLKNHIEASDLVHTLILWVSWSLLIFVMIGQFLALWPQIWYIHSNSECLDPYCLLSCLDNFWPSGGQKHSKGGVSRAPSQWYMRFEFHQNQVSASEEFMFH